MSASPSIGLLAGVFGAAIALLFVTLAVLAFLHDRGRLPAPFLAACTLPSGALLAAAPWLMPALDGWATLLRLNGAVLVAVGLRALAQGVRVMRRL